MRILVTVGGIVGFIVGLVMDTADDRDRLYSLIGLACFLLFGWIFSKHPSQVFEILTFYNANERKIQRKMQIRWDQVIWGMALQFLFGLIVLRWDTGQSIFACLGDRVATFLKYTDAGSGFVYGYLVTDQNQSGISLGTIIVFKVGITMIFQPENTTVTNLSFNRHFRSCFCLALWSASFTTTELCNGLYKRSGGYYKLLWEQQR